MPKINIFNEKYNWFMTFYREIKIACYFTIPFFNALDAETIVADISFVPSRKIILW